MGGHSTTGKHRPKRGDFRLTAKQRYAQSKKWEDAKAAADLRVVKIKKSQRKERVVDASAMRLKKPKLTPVQKKVKALEKKLVDIGKLRERKEAGEELDENQLTKLASEEDVKEDLAACKLRPCASSQRVLGPRCSFVPEQTDSLQVGMRHRVRSDADRARIAVRFGPLVSIRRCIVAGKITASNQSTIISYKHM